MFRKEAVVKFVEQPSKIRTENCALYLLTWMEMIRNLTRAVDLLPLVSKPICWDALICIDLLVFTKIKNSSECPEN